MPKEQFRTHAELTRTQWAEKFSSVTHGKLYTTEDDPLSPFPIHKYLKNKLLGDQIKMLEVNAGVALVENFVADTLTNFKLTVNGEEGSDFEKEIAEWYKEVDYDAKEEEACRSLYGNGYGVQQLFRSIEGDENTFPFITLDPAVWYPDIPTFQWQPVTSGRVISVFSEEENHERQWYAFVEKHEPGSVSYQLLKLESATALEGKVVPLSTLPRFSSLNDEESDLDIIPIFQANRQKASGDTFGTSLLYPIWDILQEISETQTQIRQERIKHLRAKFAASIESLQGVSKERVDPNTQNSKQVAEATRTQSKLYDMNQEIFPVPAGAQMPAYIQRDLESIRIGLELIDDLKSTAAGILGCPKSVFNIDEAAGNLKADTEKRKDRRYVRKVLQGQAQMAKLREAVTEAWWKWSHDGQEIDVSVTYESPFNLTQQELVDLAKSMNPVATLLSEEDAVHMVHHDKTPDERAQLLSKIKSEKRQSELANPSEIVL